MPTYDPRFWDWWTDDDGVGKLYVRRWSGPEMQRVFSARDWMWARTMNGSLKVARRCGPGPHERCPVCLRKVHSSEMVGAITGERCCHRCADDLRLLKRAAQPV